MQVTFIIDCAFNFNTAFLLRELHQWNISRRMIAKKYLEVQSNHCSHSATTQGPPRHIPKDHPGSPQVPPAVLALFRLISQFGSFLLLPAKFGSFRLAYPPHHFCHRHTPDVVLDRLLICHPYRND